MCKRFCEGYAAVDKYFWLPLSPWEEISTEQAVLAMVNVFDDLAIIDKIDNGKYKAGAKALRRSIFQMGDVFTIKMALACIHYLTADDCNWQRRIY